MAHALPGHTLVWSCQFFVRAGNFAPFAASFSARLLIGGSRLARSYDSRSAALNMLCSSALGARSAMSQPIRSRLMRCQRVVGPLVQGMSGGFFGALPVTILPVKSSMIVTRLAIRYFSGAGTTPPDRCAWPLCDALGCWSAGSRSEVRSRGQCSAYCGLALCSLVRDQHKRRIENIHSRWPPYPRRDAALTPCS
jgi:hypothetical protein